MASGYNFGSLNAGIPWSLPVESKLSQLQMLVRGLGDFGEGLGDVGKTIQAKKDRDKADATLQTELIAKGLTPEAARKLIVERQVPELSAIMGMRESSIEQAGKLAQATAQGTAAGTRVGSRPEEGDIEAAAKMRGAVTGAEMAAKTGSSDEEIAKMADALVKTGKAPDVETATAMVRSQGYRAGEAGIAGQEAQTSLFGGQSAALAQQVAEAKSTAPIREAILKGQQDGQQIDLDLKKKYGDSTAREELEALRSANRQSRMQTALLGLSLMNQPMNEAINRKMQMLQMKSMEQDIDLKVPMLKLQNLIQAYGFKVQLAGYDGRAALGELQQVAQLTKELEKQKLVAMSQDENSPIRKAYEAAKADLDRKTEAAIQKAENAVTSVDIDQFNIDADALMENIGTAPAPAPKGTTEKPKNLGSFLGEGPPPGVPTLPTPEEAPVVPGPEKKSEEPAAEPVPGPQKETSVTRKMSAMERDLRSLGIYDAKVRRPSEEAARIVKAIRAKMADSLPPGPSRDRAFWEEKLRKYERMAK